MNEWKTAIVKRNIQQPRITQEYPSSTLTLYFLKNKFSSILLSLPSSIPAHIYMQKRHQMFNSPLWCWLRCKHAALKTDKIRYGAERLETALGCLNFLRESTTRKAARPRQGDIISGVIIIISLFPVFTIISFGRNWMVRSRESHGCSGR